MRRKGRVDVHDEEPPKEAPMTPSILGRRRILTRVLCPPLQPQRLNLVLAFILAGVPAEPQAVVAVFAFPFAITLVLSPPQLLLLLVVIIALVILQIAALLLLPFIPLSFLIAHELNNSALIDAIFLAVEGEAPAVEDCAQTFAAAVGV